MIAPLKRRLTVEKKSSWKWEMEKEMESVCAEIYNICTSFE